MRKLLVLMVSGILLLVSSCKNDLNINAPWKETLVVFGLLNSVENTHYVRISKAFLGEGDAIEFAGVYDSINVNPSLLDVTVEELVNEQVTRTFTLSADSGIEKEPGIFSAPAQIVYRFETPPGQSLLSNATYVLKVKNTSSGLEIRSETDLVGQIILSQPGAFLTEYGLTPQAKTTLKIKSAENGKLYESFVYFIYREYPLNNPSDIVSKEIKINLGRLTRENVNGGETFNMEVGNKEIYQTIANNMVVSTSENQLVRLADSIRFEVNAVTEEVQVYLSVNEPSNTLAQERPEYSNIENGIGIFSSRGSMKRTYYLNDNTVDSLRSNNITQNLNFLPR
jgi:hypothetical protein